MKYNIKVEYHLHLAWREDFLRVQVLQRLVMAGGANLRNQYLLIQNTSCKIPNTVYK